MTLQTMQLGAGGQCAQIQAIVVAICQQEHLFRGDGVEGHEEGIGLVEIE